MISVEDDRRRIAWADFGNAHLTTQRGDRGSDLAAACASVNGHGGDPGVDSEVGEGTAFAVCSPAALQSQQAVAGLALASATASKRILLMDDDEAIGEVVDVALRSLGYEVVITRDGTEALRHYREAQSARQPFAVVILDLSVPGGMGGEETIRELRKLDPDVKAILSSGSCGLPILGRHREYGFCRALPKPYRMEDMEQVLREVLCPREALSASRA